MSPPPLPALPRRTAAPKSEVPLTAQAQLARVEAGHDVAEPEPAPVTVSPPLAETPSEDIDLSDREDALAKREKLPATIRAFVDLCEAELRVSGKGPRTARLLYELGRIEEVFSKDPSRALARYEAAREQAPDHLPTLRALRRLHLTGQRFREALALYDAEFRWAPTSEKKAGLLFAKLLLLDRALDETRSAQVVGRQALRILPNHASVAHALLGIERRLGDASGVDAAYAALIAAVHEDPALLAALWAERGRHAETQLRDVRAATVCYEAAVQAGASTPGAAVALRRLLRSQGRFRELAERWIAAAESSDDPQRRAAAFREAARLHHERLLEPGPAIELLRRARDARPTDARVLHELARHEERAGDTAGLVDTLERISDLPLDPATRLTICERLANLYQRELPNEAMSLHWHQEVLLLRPDHLPSVHALEDIFAARGTPEASIRVWVAYAEATRDARAAAQAHRKVAELHERQGRPDDAILHLSRAFELDPRLESALWAQSRIYASLGAHDQVAHLHRAAMQATQDPALRASHAALVGQALERTGDYEGATRIYRSIIDAPKDNLTSLHLLARTAEAGGDDDALAAALELEVRRTRDRTRLVDLLHRLGRVLERRPEHAERALLRYRQAHRLDPNAPGVHESLGRALARQGAHEELLEMYERALPADASAPEDAAIDPPWAGRTVHLLLQLAHVAENGLGDPARAVAYLRRALGLDPSHAPARAWLLRLLSQGDRGELATELARSLDLPDDLSTKAERAHWLGLLCEHHLGELPRAFEAYRKATDFAPNDPTFAEAADSVAYDLADGSGLVARLLAAAGRLRDKEHLGARVDAEFRAAMVLIEPLRAIPEALATLERARRDAPHEPRVLHALSALYDETRRLEPLAHVELAKAQATTDKGAQVASLHALSALFSYAGLGDPEDLRKGYLAILGRDGNDLVALEGLEQLALRTGHPSMLVDVDRRIAASDAPNAVRASHETRSGLTLEATHPETALAAFVRALEHDPEDLLALHLAIHVAESVGEQLARRDLGRMLAAALRDPVLASRAFFAAAKVSHEILHDAAAAIEDLGLALARDPDHGPAAELLVKLAEPRGETRPLVETLAQAATRATLVERRRSLWRQIARIELELHQDTTAAIAALQRCLETVPGDSETMTVLAECQLRSGAWQAAAHTLERIASVGASRTLAEDALRKLAWVAREHLHERTREAQALEALLRLEPNDRASVHRLFEARLALGELEDARKLARRLLGSARSPSDEASALMCLGEIDLQAGDRDKARKAWLMSIGLEGATGPAAKRFESLFDAAGAYHEYAEALEGHLAQIVAGKLPVETAAATFLELGRVKFDRLGRPDDAFSTWQAGVKLCHDDAALRLELARRLAAAGRFAPAGAEFLRFASAHPTNPEGWRGLSRALAEQQREIESRLALAPLRAVSASLPAEDALIDSVTVGFEHIAPGAFSPEAIRWISTGPAAETSATALLSSLSEAFAKIYPIDLKALGVGSRHRLRERSEHPISAIALRLSDVFGARSYELYLSDTIGPDIIIAPSLPPAILVPASVAARPSAERVFLLARAFTHIARGVHPALRLGGTELARVLTSLARQTNPEYTVQGLEQEPPEALRELADRLLRAVSRKQRKAVDDAIAKFASARPLEPHRWITALTTTASRIGAIACGDLSHAIAAARFAAQDSDTTRAEAVANDLFRFWASEPAFELRQRAGVLALR